MTQAADCCSLGIRVLRRCVVVMVVGGDPSLLG